MPQHLSAVPDNVDRSNDDLSSEAAQLPTKDDTLILLLCEKLIATGEADTEAETRELVDQQLRRLADKYQTKKPPHISLADAKVAGSG